MKPEDKSKTPSLLEKIELYERFLHKINAFVTICDHEGVKEMVSNADAWSYAHRKGNGELTDEQQQDIINKAFWTLCDTPKADKYTKERQRRYTERHTKSRRCPDCGWALYDGIYGMNKDCCKGKEIEEPVMMSNFDYAQKYGVKPKWKLNNGRGATLCNKCDIIIVESLSNDLYCENCKNSK